MVLLGLPLSSVGGTAADNCEVVQAAAVAGRDQTNTRIDQYEIALKQAMDRQRACLEKFADLASRQAVVIGGFDASALRDFLQNEACNLIDSKVNAAANQAGLNNAYQRVQSAYEKVPALTTQPQSVGTSTSTRSSGSIFDRMSCWVSSSC